MPARLESTSAGWRVATREGWWEAREVVVALGPWSDDVLRPLGYRFPLGWKRGYHMHYRADGNAALNRPVVDGENGFALMSMSKGIRLTTGAEFALRDAPKTPVQIERTERLAREIFPITERVEPEPWLGRRPCLPDMLPVIGPAGRHKGLWLSFGHHHLGFTLGPVSGRLLAEMMTGRNALHRSRALSRRPFLNRNSAYALPNLSRQDGSAPANGRAVASYTPRAMARARQSAAARPISVRSTVSFRSGLRKCGDGKHSVSVHRRMRRPDGAGQPVVRHDRQPFGLRLGEDGVGGDQRDGRRRRRAALDAHVESLRWHGGGRPRPPNSPPTSRARPRNADRRRSSPSPPH